MTVVIPEKRHRLHIRSDRGTVGWTGLFPTFATLGVVGSFFWDDAHKVWDDCRLGVWDAGLGVLFVALLMASVCVMRPSVSARNQRVPLGFGSACHF